MAALLIYNEDTCTELCRALRVSKTATSTLRLRLNKLDLSKLDVSEIVDLLELIEKEVLEITQISFREVWECVTVVSYLSAFAQK